MISLWVQILIGLSPSCATIIVAGMAYAQSRKNSKAIQEVHLTINSRMSEFLALAKKSSKAEGVIQGRAEGLTVSEEPVKRAADETFRIDPSPES